MNPALDTALADTHAPHPAASLAARLMPILTALWDLVIDRSHRLGNLAHPLSSRIARARERLLHLLLALAAGRLPRHRPRTPGQPARRGGPRPTYLPHRRAWLVAIFGYRAAGYASQLEAVLSDPAIQAALATAIAQSPGIARTLRPLCRMLGVPLPPPLQPALRPAQPRPKPAPKPPRPALPPLLPFYPQRRPRHLPFLRPPPKLRPA